MDTKSKISLFMACCGGVIFSYASIENNKEIEFLSLDSFIKILETNKQHRKYKRKKVNYTKIPSSRY
jgi:hypothetical protein